MEIPDSLPDNFAHLGVLPIHEQTHQPVCEYPHNSGHCNTEYRSGEHSPLQTRPDAVLLFRAVILRDEGGESVAEILHRHVGEGVNFHRGGKSRHHHGAEAVDQPLDHEDAQVHDRLLDAGQDGEAGDFPDAAPGDPPPLQTAADLGTADKGICHDAQPGEVLGDHGGLRSAGGAPLQAQHKEEVQRDIEQGGQGQENQRHKGIAHCPQEGREIVVQEGGRDAAEDNGQVLPHDTPHLLWNPQKDADAGKAQKGGGIQQEGHCPDQEKGGGYALLQLLLILLPEPDGEYRPAAHAQSQQNRG